jgi:fructose-bisphosphate aldolase class II
VALQTLATTLSRAETGGYAVGAFNVSDLNQAVAVLDAARSENSPVIVQAIAGIHPYVDEGWWWDRLRQLVESYPDVEVTLHLDHGRTVDDCVRAMEHGFTSVMIDASRHTDSEEPSSFTDNIELTRRVVELARPRGVSVVRSAGSRPGGEATPRRSSSQTPTRQRSSWRRPASTPSQLPSVRATVRSSSRHQRAAGA